MGELVRMLRDETRRRSDEIARAAQDAAWELECAWMAILPGDIDDLAEHVSLEGGARMADAESLPVTVNFRLTCLEATECVVFFHPARADVSLENGSSLLVELRGDKNGMPEVSYLQGGLSVSWPGAETRVRDAAGREIRP